MVDLARISLEAVIVSVTDDSPRVLLVESDAGWRLPAGPLAANDRTLELGLRRWVADETGLELGYVEQLYSFGDLDRDRQKGPRLIGLAYLALIREAAPASGATWMDCYELFPWEDHRHGRPPIMDREIQPRLARWAGHQPRRSDRAAIAFGLEGTPWDGVRALERFELLYEARLVSEWYIDHDQPMPNRLPSGMPLAHDHRRVVATALARVRGKLTYRPVVFELLPSLFTLSQLQAVVEALAGIRLHKQNFRRLVEQGGLVEGSGRLHAGTGGRPAELFRFRREVLRERPRPGVG